MNKKAISTLTATVLVIGFTIVLAGVVYTFFLPLVNNANTIYPNNPTSNGALNITIQEQPKENQLEQRFVCFYLIAPISENSINKQTIENVTINECNDLMVKGIKIAHETNRTFAFIINFNNFLEVSQ